jgi:hypothetical protein
VRGVDPGIRLDAGHLEPGDGDLDPVGGHCQDDWALGLDMVEAGEILDAGRTEPDGRSGIYFGKSVTNRGQSSIEFSSWKTSCHDRDSAEKC